MNCVYCSDTGSLSRDLEGELDCVHCDVAQERAALEAWAARERILYGTESSIWLIYQHGKAAGAVEVARTGA